MSLLASLAAAYDRLPGAPPYGFSSEKVGFAISLDEHGTVCHVVDLRGEQGRKRTLRTILAPQPPKKASGIKPNFLWEKSAYALGVTLGEGKRTAQEHQAFKDRHAEWLGDTNDPGLLAFLRFLEKWSPDQFVEPVWLEEMKDQNFIFGLESERLSGVWLHNRPAAKKAWLKVIASMSSESQLCLVTGERGPVARLHPSIKGVWDAQPSGASIVSFNADAYESYGHKQGDNAPVSEAAAFAYTTALNHFLTKDSGHRIQIGDASTVFWADGSAVEAEELFFGAFGGGEVGGEDEIATREIKLRLEMIQKGTALAQVAPDLAKGVRFHVLGLAPNAARLSVRFHYEDDFGTLIANYQNHIANLSVDPAPRGDFPPLWRYLQELAVLGKRENVPPNLAGDWMRAILTGQKYPITLLSTTLMRLRGDGDVNALRAGILKSVLIRNLNVEVPVALDPTSQNKGYILGRLFAVYEEVQRAALGGKVNATIKDKFYGSASATPQKVFAVLDRGSANHFAKLRKQSPGWGVNLEKLLTSITDLMEPGQDPIPVALTSAEQAMFGIGYYHQRAEAFRKRETQTDTVEMSK